MNNNKQWISVKNKLPVHDQRVYALTGSKLQCVTIFIDNKIVASVMRSVGIEPGEITKGVDYSFCSQELQGNVLNNVTHWMPLIDPPEDSSDE